MARPFSNLTRQARERLLNVGMLFALGLWLVGAGYYLFQSSWLNDMAPFWAGARTFLDGGNPYHGFYSYPLLSLSEPRFYSLPWVLLFLVPFALLPLPTAMIIAAVMQWLLLVGLVFLVFGACKRQVPLWQLALLEMVGVYFSLRCMISGQWSILMTVGLILTILFLRRGKDFKAGLWAGLLLFKPWIGLGGGIALALLVIVRHRWKAAAGFALISLFMVGIATCVIPTWFLDYFPMDISGAVQGTVNGVANVWPLATPADFFQYVLNIDLAGAGKIALWAGWILLGLGLAVWTVVLWRRGKLGDEALVGVGVLLGLMLSPYVRYYDYALLFIWVAAFGGLEWARLTRRGRVGLVVCMTLAVVITFGTHPEPWVILSLLALYGGTAWALADVSHGKAEINTTSRWYNESSSNSRSRLG